MRPLSTALLLGLPLCVSAADSDLPAARDRQAAVQADTEQLARRVGTMLRVMEHYKLDAGGEKKLLEEAAGTLGGLSQKQMTEVLNQLDAAMKAADAESANKQVDAAYAGHRDALRKLKNLLGRYDAIRDLDSAVHKLDKLARDEVELGFRISDVLQDSLDGSSADPVRRKRVIRADFPSNRARREAEEQNDHRKEFDAALKQLRALRLSLRADQRERLTYAEQLLVDRDIATALAELTTRIRPEGTVENRHRDWEVATQQAWAVAAILQEASLSLRAPKEKLLALREARQNLSAAVDKLTEQRQAAHDFALENAAREPEAPAARPRGGLFFNKMIADDPVITKTRQLADENGRLAHSVRGIQVQLKTLAPGPASSLARAVALLHIAGQATRQYAPLFAVGYRTWADAQLRTALAELDLAIAAAEKERADPLAATEAALKQIDQLIKEQKAIAEETNRSAESRDADAARQQAQKERELAKQTEATAQSPLPTPPQTKELIKDAANSMKKAGTDLDTNKTEAAKRDQQAAIEKLEAAKKDLLDAAEKINQRREEVAQLEELEKKLGNLVKEQQAVADRAKQQAASDKPDNRETAKQQEKVKPPTNELAKDLQEMTPEVAKEVAKAAEKMEAAQKLLKEDNAKDAAWRAERAQKDLQRAERMLKDEIANRKAEELFDQSKLQPNNIDPVQAARELSKAMEQTDEAQKASAQAQKNPASENLAKKQEELAKLAEKLGEEAAAELAKNAAKDLNKGELKQALTEQQKALSEMAKQAQADAGKENLAKDQKALMEATQQLAKSQEATTMAQEAIKQAMANSPDQLKQQLEQAAQQLDKAGQELQKGDAQKANQAQNKAKDSLDQLMQMIEQAAAMAEQMPQMPPPKPGEQPGEQPGDKPGQNPNETPDATENPNGNRPPDQLKQNAKAQLTPGDADGSFLHLPARQRELIKQALAEKLPPEYSSLIQQYFVNVAKGKPATKPAAEPARPKP
ncbi:MAG: hypothetical protein K1X57_03240 [Gemmataceae bacterium]|nr:hypothetical protein [Gemmataceae bacterium]